MAEKLKYLDGQDEIRIDVNQTQDGQAPVRVEGPGSQIIRSAPQGSVMDRIRQGILQRRAAQSQPAESPTTPTEPVIPPDQSRSFAPFEDSAPITDLKFDKALANTLGYEGAGVDRNEVGDSGISQLGVTQKAWDAYSDKIKAPRKPVTKLSDKERRQFYKDEYAKPLNLDNLPDDVAMIAFDYGVNAGPGRAARDLQTVLGVKADGAIGPKTLAAIKRQNPKALAEKLLAMQESHYARLVKENPEKYGKFQAGWQNRINAQRQKLALGDFGQKVREAMAVEEAHPELKYPDDLDLKIKFNPWVSQTLAGLDALNAQIARIPAYAYNLAAVPQNMIAAALGRTDQQVVAPDWLTNNPIAAYYDKSKQLNDKSDERFGYVTEVDENGIRAQRPTNLSDIIESGEASEAAAYIGWKVLENAPQQLMLLGFSQARIADLGLGFMGLMAAAGKSAENSKKNLDPVTSTLNATLSGVTEVATEKLLGTPKVFKDIKEQLIKKFGAEGAKIVLKEAATIFLKGSSSEFIEEVVASFAEDISDWFMGVNPNALKGMVGRAFESGVIGGASGFAMTSPAAAVSAYGDIRQIGADRQDARISAMEQDGQRTKAERPAETHMMEHGRGQRERGRATITPEEAYKIEQAAQRLGKRVSEVENDIRRIKRAYPQKDGWTPVEFLGLDDNDDYKFQSNPYTFDRGSDGRGYKPGTKEYEKRAGAVASKMYDEFKAVYERAKNGDKNAQKIMAQSKWYAKMRARLRAEFGSIGDVLADLLGATSPNTPVRENWNNAVEFMRRAQRGDYDQLLPGWLAWQQGIDEAENALKAYFNEMRFSGLTKKAIKESTQYMDLLEKARQARKFPDSLLPRKEAGPLYGFNGKNVAIAAINIWRTIKGSDPDIQRGGQAPKALNFSGNLIGFRRGATIDVWAARMLQRLSGGVRIAPVAETGVSGEMLPNGTTTGQFGFGQDVFSRASKKIKSDEAMPEHSDIGDDDLQAVVWFIEKELWTRKGWTNRAGEGGSFELEASLAGHPNRERIAYLRRVIDAQNTTPQQKEDALNELRAMEGGVDRFVPLVTTATEANIPSDEELARAMEELRAAAYEGDSNAAVLGSHFAASLGVYGGQERTIDSSVITRRGYDYTPFWKKTLEIAKRYGQDAVGLARVLREDESYDPLQHRPGIEIYFQDSKSYDESKPMLDELAKRGIDMYTVSVDARRMPETLAGKMPKAVGVRFIVTPEFMVRFGDTSWLGLNNEELSGRIEAEAERLQDAADDIISNVEGVSYAKQHWYAIDNRFSHEYESTLDALTTRVSQEERSKTRSEAWQGRSLREALASADRQSRGQDSGTEVAGRVSRLDQTDQETRYKVNSPLLDALEKDRKRAAFLRKRIEKVQDVEQVLDAQEELRKTEDRIEENEKALQDHFDKMVEFGKDIKFSRPATDELGNELGYEEEKRRNEDGLAFIREFLPEIADLVEQPASLTTDSGMRLLGDYLRGRIRAKSGQPLSVYKHEGFHAFFDLFVSPQDKIRLLDAIQREYPDKVKAYADKYGASQDRAAEEVMAELMENIDNKRFIYEGKSIPEQIVTFLQQVIEKMKVFFGIDKAIIQDMADAFYEMRRTPSQARMTESRFLYGGERAVGFNDLSSPGFIAPDNKIRFEIPDEKADLSFKGAVEALTKEAERIRGDGAIHWMDRNKLFDPIKKKLEDAIKSKRTLGAMLDHPELYKRYPWAKDVPVIVKKLPRGTMGQAANSYQILSPEGSHIRISSRYLDNMTSLYSNSQMESYEDFRNTLLHEVQHMIQAYENFAQGGSVSKYGFLNYVRLLGEVESRDVEARSRMTDEQRKALAAYESQVDPVEAASRDNWKRKIRGLDDVVVRQTGQVDFETPRIYGPGQSRAAQIAKYFFKKTPIGLPTKPVTVYAVRVADGANAGKDFNTFPSTQVAGETFESKSAALAALKNLDVRIADKKKQHISDYRRSDTESYDLKYSQVKAYVIRETHSSKKSGDEDSWTSTRQIDRKIVATEEDAANFDETKILEELQRRMVGEKKKAIKSESSDPMYKIDERDSDILKDIGEKLKYGGYTQAKIQAEYAERGIDIQFKGEAIRVSPSKVKDMAREVTGQVKDEELRDLKDKFREQSKGARFGYRQGVTDAREKLTTLMREKLEKQAERFEERRRSELETISQREQDARERREEKADERLAKAEARAKAKLEAERADTEAEAEAVQSIKEAIVDYALEQLPKSERGTLLTVVRDAKTLNDAMEAGKKIDQILEQSQKKGAIGRIRALIGQAMDSGRMAVEYKDIVKKLVSGVELKGHREETLKDLQKTKDFIEAELKAGRDVEIPNRIYRALQILERKPAAELELSELEAIITKIELVIKLGKLRLASREAQYEADKVAKLKELGSGRVRPIRSKEGARDARLALLDKLIQQAKDRNDQAKLKKLEAEQTKLMKQKAFRVEAKGWLESIRDYFDKNVANSQLLDKARQPMDHFFQTIGDQYHRVFKAPLDLLYGNYTQELQALTDRTAKILKELKLDATNFRRIGIFAANEQDNGREKLLKSGITEAQIDAIKLTPEEKRFYDFMQTEMETLYPRYKDVIQNVYNAPVGKVAKYFPFMTDYTEMSELEVRQRLMENPEFQTQPKKNVDLSASKSRVDRRGNVAVRIDANEVFMKHMQSVLYAVHMAKEIKMLQEIAKSPKFATAAGDVAQFMTVEWLDLMARNGGIAGQDPMPFLDFVRKNTSLAMLSLNPTSIAIQSTAIIDASGFIGRYAFSGQTMQGSREWRDFAMNNSAELRNRVGDDQAYREFSDAWYDKLRSAAMTPQKILDGTVATGVFLGAYQKFMDEKGIKADPKSPNREGVEYANKMVRMSQASALFKDLPLFISKGTGTNWASLIGKQGKDNRSWGKAWSQFQTPLFYRYANLRDYAVTKAMDGKWKEAANVVGSQVLAVITEIALRHGVKGLTALAVMSMLGKAGGGDDEEKEFGDYLNEFFTTFVGNVPFISNAMSLFTYKQAPVASLAIAGRTLEDFKNWQMSKKPETKRKWAAILALDLAAIATGAPTPRLTYVIKKATAKPKKKALFL